MLVTQQYSLNHIQLCNGTASLLPGCAIGGGFNLVQLDNGPGQPCVVLLCIYITGQPHIARLRNRTALSLPGCITGLPHCVTGYHQFGVVHLDSWLHNPVT